MLNDNERQILIASTSDSSALAKTLVKKIYHVAAIFIYEIQFLSTF